MDLKASQEIDDYIGNDSSADTGKTIKIPYKGSHTEFTVYRLPTKLLRFRLENTRFEVQKMQDEATNGPIDPDEEAGEKRLIKLLLGTPKNKDLVSLRGSIERDGQLQPGAITYDGAVINGNRRMACIKVLYEETSQDKFQYFDCVRIPKGATEEDIFKLETYFQWAKEYRVDYSPINNYMMLKKAITLKWKPEQIPVILILLGATLKHLVNSSSHGEKALKGPTTNKWSTIPFDFNAEYAAKLISVFPLPGTEKLAVLGVAIMWFIDFL